MIDGPSELARQIIDAQARGHEVKVIDLSRMPVSYDVIVDEIFAHDRVIAW